MLLCAFHQGYKISEDVFDTWCHLLAQRPDAHLWLLQWNASVIDGCVGRPCAWHRR